MANSRTSRARNTSVGAAEQLEPRCLLSHSTVAPPAAPSDLLATAVVGAPVIRLTWSDHSSKEAGLIVQRKKGRSGAWATAATLAGGATYYRSGHLAEHTVYSYRVAAFNRRGSSAWTAPATAVSGSPAEPIVDGDFGTGGNAVRADRGEGDALAISPDGGTLYVASNFTWDLTPGTPTPTIDAMDTTGAGRPAFGHRGRVVVNSALPTAMGWIVGMAVQADGKLLVAGTASNTASGGSTGIVLARFNADGSRDTTFGGSGTGEAAASFGDREELGAMTLAADGTIYIGGVDDYSGAGRQRQFFVARLNSDGTVDRTYGSNGIVQGDRPTVPQNPTIIGDVIAATSMAIDPTDGSIVIAGGFGYLDNMGVGSPGTLIGARVTPDGSVTDLFGNQSSNAEALDITIQADGKIVVATELTQVLRFNADGTADRSWVGPRFSAAVRNQLGSEPGLAQMPDGSLLFVGWRRPRTDEGFVAHLDASDGSVIGSFTEQAGTEYYHVAISPDGSIFATGENNGGLVVSKYTLA